MVRFIDCTDEDSDIIQCAFLDTITNRFIMYGDGTHIFSSLDEVEEHEFADRLLRLIPDGFFEGSLL